MSKGDEIHKNLVRVLKHEHTNDNIDYESKLKLVSDKIREEDEKAFEKKTDLNIIAGFDPLELISAINNALFDISTIKSIRVDDFNEKQITLVLGLRNS